MAVKDKSHLTDKIKEQKAKDGWRYTYSEMYKQMKAADPADIIRDRNKPPSEEIME
jgi:hypothetical protein